MGYPRASTFTMGTRSSSAASSDEMDWSSADVYRFSGNAAQNRASSGRIRIWIDIRRLSVQPRSDSFRNCSLPFCVASLSIRTAALRALRICFALLLTVFTIPGQTLEVNPVSVSPGSANIFRVLLKTNPAKPLAGLQWDLVYPAARLRIELAGILPGSAAEAAGKSITCARRPSDANTAHVTCILAGGVRPVSAGVLAIVRLDAEPRAPKGVITVGLEQVVGVSASIESIPIASVTVKVKIR
jgi:hypothetical protein